MVNSNVRCALVKIHGVGNQAEDWSSGFDAMLDSHMATLSATQRDAFVNESVWWADISHLLVTPASGAGLTAGVVATTPTLAQTQALLANEYMNYLEQGGAAEGAMPAVFGLPDPTKVFARLKDVVVSYADSANDVANYVSNNNARLQILHRLRAKLVEVSTSYPNASIILGSHSQGTIVCYDLLRLGGGDFPNLSTWVTMGCPLNYYLNFLRWGTAQLEVRSNLTWLNYFDSGDKVGKAISGLTDWASPTPTDLDVDNRGNGLDAHDHWHNPSVVERYFELVQQHLQ